LSFPFVSPFVMGLLDCRPLLQYYMLTVCHKT
jgi:hypothetical protein